MDGLVNRIERVQKRKNYDKKELAALKEKEMYHVGLMEKITKEINTPPEKQDINFYDLINSSEDRNETKEDDKKMKASKKILIISEFLFHIQYVSL